MALWVFNPDTLDLPENTDLTTEHGAPDAWSSFERTGTIRYAVNEMVLESASTQYAQTRRSSLNTVQLVADSGFSGTAPPSAERRLYEFRSGAASGYACLINIDTANRVKIYNTSGSLLRTMDTVLPSDGSEYRVYAGVKRGTNTTTGSIHVRIYLGDSSTPVEVWEFDNLNTGTFNITQFRLGWVSTVAWTLRTRYVQMEDAALGPIGRIAPIVPTFGVVRWIWNAAEGEWQ